MLNEFDHHDPAPEGYYCVGDLMQRWGCGRTKAYDLIHAPEFPQPLRVGRHLRFARHQVWAYEAAQLAEPGTTPLPTLPPTRRPGPARQR
jgi:predicted DNA-binding transcriptional regulator AlpA